MCGTRIYNSYNAMKGRCTNPNCKSYNNYGGRGITICDRWLGKNGFKHFYEDMGEMPREETLDRIDNNGNYEPNNCKWSTRKEQQNNRRTNHLLSFNNRTQTLKQWSEETGINKKTLWNRIDRGWTVSRALTSLTH